MLDCILVGDVMMDIVLRADHKILSALNLEGTNYFKESLVQPGGCGNVAASTSYLGGRVALIGRAGDDSYGIGYVRDLKSRKIIPKVNLDRSSSTGVTVSIVEPGGHRTMLVSRGANDSLTKVEARKHFNELGRSKFVYLSGYSLANLPQREAILETAQRVHNRAESTIVFDAASLNLIRNNRRLFTTVIESCDILCANLDEAIVLADKIGVPDYVRNKSKNGRTVIVKMGANGCLLGKDGRTVKISGYPVNSVDTTGAGDAFLGSVIYCLSRDIELVKAASYANWFASHITTGLGPRHFPARATASRMLKRIGGNNRETR